MPSEWEIYEALLGIRGRIFMYYSVNMYILSVSTDGETEYLKPTEKALRSEGVAIF